MSKRNSKTALMGGDLSRRDLLRYATLTAGSAMLAGISPRSYAAAARSSYSIGIVALEIDGVVASTLSSVEGGAGAGVVVSEPSEDGILRKRLADVRFEDLIVKLPIAECQPLMGWIGATLSKGPLAKNGAIVYYDFNRAEVKRLEFFGGLLTEISLPACDGASKDPALLTLRISPQSTRLTGGSGKGAPMTAMALRSVAAQNSAFRLNIQGLEAACGRVSKIEALSAKRSLSAAEVGVRREATGRPLGPLDCSMLSIAIPEQDGPAFYAWFNDFVINGNNSAKSERAARLEWLARDMTTPMVTADLGNLGIVRYESSALTGNGDRIATVQVGMYCETLNLTVNGA